MESALIPELTSSDEEQDTSLHTKKTYIIKELPWVSNKLSRRKKQLDEFYRDNIASKRQLSTMPVFVYGEAKSTRKVPSLCT